MRRISKVLAVLAALVAAMILVPASPAAAGDSGACPGNLVLHKLLTYSGNTIGELDIYWDASTQKNCAKMNHGGPTWGVARETWAYIAKCQATTPTGTCYVMNDDYDQGSYSYYAGPVKVTAGTHCIQANGWIYWDGARRKVATGDTVACG